MLLSVHEAVVWWEYEHGKPTTEIASEYEKGKRAPAYVYDLFSQSSKESERESIKHVLLKDTQYVSRVINRARSKIEKALLKIAKSHRLDIESVLESKGLLIGFDYQANSEVYIIYTMKLDTVVWYKHDSYAGKLCPECPRYNECRETLDTILEEYDITLRPDEEQLYMTQQSQAIFNKLAAKEDPKYKRSEV